MIIPEAFRTPEYQDILVAAARHGLTQGALLPNRNRKPFAAERYGGDLNALAWDLVQETYRHVLEMDEREKIQNWHGFLRSQLNYQILRVCTKSFTWPKRAANSDGSRDAADLHDLCEMPTQEEWIFLNELIEICRREMQKLVTAGKIRQSNQVEPFLQIMRRYLESPLISFDTHRQEVEAINPHTPSKANANRWWNYLRVILAESMTNMMIMGDRK